MSTFDAWVDQMRAWHRNAAALVQAQCGIWLGDRSAMTVDGADELALLEAIVEIGRQAQ